MSVEIHRPAPAAAEKPAGGEAVPDLGTATFHQVAQSPAHLPLIEIAPRPSPASTAWDLANAPPSEVAETPPPAVPPPQPGSGNWRRHIGTAKVTWSKLSSGELERVRGDQALLVKLLLRHYSFDRHEAGRLVRNFFERNRI